MKTHSSVDHPESFTYIAASKKRRRASYEPNNLGHRATALYYTRATTVVFAKQPSKDAPLYFTNALCRCRGHGMCAGIGGCGGILFEASQACVAREQPAPSKHDERHRHACDTKDHVIPG